MLLQKAKFTLQGNLINIILEIQNSRNHSEFTLKEK